MAPPTGTVTFLFSDIEGSTVRWERDRVAMDATVAAHDDLLREMIGSHSGFVFKMVGDSRARAIFERLGAVKDDERAPTTDVG